MCISQYAEAYNESFRIKVNFSCPGYSSNDFMVAISESVYQGLKAEYYTIDHRKIHQHENIDFSILSLINSDIPISSDNITFTLFRDEHVVATQVVNIPHMNVYNKVTGAKIHVNDQTADKNTWSQALVTLPIPNHINIRKKAIVQIQFPIGYIDISTNVTIINGAEVEGTKQSLGIAVLVVNLFNIAAVWTVAFLGKASMST